MKTETLLIDILEVGTFASADGICELSLFADHAIEWGNDPFKVKVSFDENTTSILEIDSILKSSLLHEKDPLSKSN